MPPRLLPRRQPPAPPSKIMQPSEEETASSDVDDSTPDYLLSGDDAKKRVQDSAQPKNFLREFFITANEVKAGNGQAEVRVHLCANYADKKYQVAVPRCTIKDGKLFRSYTSVQGDCALAAAGVAVSVRPVFVVMDHRQFTRKDNSTGKDDIKFWIPQPSHLGLMTTAIKNLAESLGEEPENINVMDYVLKITKVGEGRRSTWAFNFIAKKMPLNPVQKAAVDKFFEKGYRQTLSKYLAPDPKYMISKGGSYVKPTEAARGGHQDDGDDAPPFE